MSDHREDLREDESRSNYIRILSHQLKSPINSTQSLLNTIIEGFTGETNPKTLYLMKKAVEGINDAKEIISDLLDYELYAQHQQFTQEEIDLSVFVHALVKKYFPRAAEADLALHLDIPLTWKIFVLSDRRGLDHALRNLLENAIKYTPAAGRINVKLSIAPEEHVCRIEITDTGYGIPEDDLEKIFEPFYRSLKHKFMISGTGLGLPLVKRIIASHNGRLTVASQENKGTTFTITLPYTNLVESAAAVADRKKVVIIGGRTAGPQAAARLRRLDEDLEITIIEQTEFFSYSGCSLPLYITDKIPSAQALMVTADNSIRDINRFEAIENITVLNNTVALAIDRARRLVAIQHLKDQTLAHIPYDILILATGTEVVTPPIPGIAQPGIYSLRDLEQAEAIKKELALETTQDIGIIGGGLIGTSTAESLIQPGVRVTIFEKQPYLLFDLMDHDMALKIQHELRKKGVKIMTEAAITKIERFQERLLIMTAQQAHAADLIILATGVKPNTALAAQAGLGIGNSGGIRVSPELQTTDAHIYAVGDCAESANLITKQHEYWPLGSVSTKMGRIAADNICGRRTEFHGSIGTAMFKIVDVNVARTGLTLRRAREKGFDAEAVVVSGLDRASYYEHARYIILKVIADRQTRVILGAQGYGKGDVVAKVQLLAEAITQALTLDAVFALDLGYAPAFNTPVDIVQVACLVLTNKIEQLLRTITIDEFEREKNGLKRIVDVSPFSEHAFHSIPRSINIPLENIRVEGIPFEKDADVVLYSNTSAGAYKAYRYLASQGYAKLRVLEGGHVGWE